MGQVDTGVSIFKIVRRSINFLNVANENLLKITLVDGVRREET